MAPGEGGGGGREVQHVWVYCEGPEAAEVVAVCDGSGAGRVRLAAQVLETRPARLEWQGPLYDRVPRLPAPYVSGERREFWADAGALLGASVANQRRRAGAAGPPAAGAEEKQRGLLCCERWPALLVTDREKLGKAAASPALRHSLARAAGLPDRDLLPVVMAHDFGRLVGVLVAGSPLASCRSLALQAPPAAAAAARRGSQGGRPPSGQGAGGRGAQPAWAAAAPHSQRPAAAPRPAAPPLARLATTQTPQAQSVGLRMGVYVQNATSIRGANSAGVTPAGGAAAGSPLAAPGGDTAAASSPAPARFGARCLALFEDGWGAYAALSPDGACSAEACGPWAVINGHVVIHGAASLNRLSRTGAAQRAVGPGYPELVHVPLEELDADFSAPVSLAEVIPQRDRLRLTLQGRPGSPRGARASAAAAAADPREVPQMPQLSMTYTADAFELVLGSSRTARSADEAQEEPQPPSTAVHALVALSGLDSPEPAVRSPTPDSSSPVHPRLLGFERGLTAASLHRATVVVATAPDPDAAPDVAGGGQPASAAAAEAKPWWPAVLQRLRRYAGERPDGKAAGAARSFETCPLRPGSYQFTTGEPGSFEFKKLELTLHADGGCDLREDSRAGTLRSVPGCTSWHVEGDLLVLQTRDHAAHGYVVRQARGNKSVERQVEKVELPMELLLDKSEYTLPEQVDVPFPGHETQEAERLVFGVVDRDSPVLSGLRNRPDRLPYHAFEKELRIIGIPCDNVLTDLRFIDRDEDGLISAAEMQLLQGYGAPRAAPEDIHSLREALVGCYGSLGAAWRQLEDCAEASQKAANKAANKTRKGNAKGAKGGPTKDGDAPLDDGGGITPAAFEDFLFRAGSDTPPGQVKGAAPLDNHKLRDWVARTTPEDREAVFESLNPNNNASIDEVDFMSLSLHSAVLAVRRLDHLRSWLAEEFGTGPEVYKQVFQSIGKAKTVNRAGFVDGLEALGYPLDQRAIESIFSILDRNCNGEVSLQEFGKLAEFSAEQVFKTMDALKRYVDESMGGVQAAFKAFVQREKALQSLQTLPSYASSTAFEKACKQAGFLKAFPDSDLKLIFVFISEASGKRSNGFLTASDWAVLEGFNSRALSGSPARLRKMLEERYGGTAQAFERMHTSWLTRALAKGLKQAAIARLVHALVSGGDEGGGAGGGAGAGAGAAAARAEAHRSSAPCAGTAAPAAAGGASARRPSRQQQLPQPAAAECGPASGRGRPEAAHAGCELEAEPVQDCKPRAAPRPRSAVGPALRRRHNLLPRPASRGPDRGRGGGVWRGPTSAIDWGLVA